MPLGSCMSPVCAQRLGGFAQRQMGRQPLRQGAAQPGGPRASPGDLGTCMAMEARAQHQLSPRFSACGMARGCGISASLAPRPAPRTPPRQLLQGHIQTGLFTPLQ